MGTALLRREVRELPLTDFRGNTVLAPTVEAPADTSGEEFSSAVTGLSQPLQPNPNPALVAEYQQIQAKLAERQKQQDALQKAAQASEVGKKLREQGGDFDSLTSAELKYLDNADELPTVITGFAPVPSNLDDAGKAAVEADRKAMAAQNKALYDALPVGSLYMAHVVGADGSNRAIGFKRKRFDDPTKDPTVTRGGVWGNLTAIPYGFEAGLSDAIARVDRLVGADETAKRDAAHAQAAQLAAAERGGTGAGAGQLAGALAPGVVAGVASAAALQPEGVAGAAGLVGGALRSIPALTVAGGAALAPAEEEYRRVLELTGDPDKASKAAAVSQAVNTGLNLAVPKVARGIAGRLAGRTVATAATEGLSPGVAQAVEQATSTGAKTVARPGVGARVLGGAAANVFNPDIENEIESRVVGPDVRRDVPWSERLLSAAVGGIGEGLTPAARPPANGLPEGGPRSPEAPSVPREPDYASPAGPLEEAAQQREDAVAGLPIYRDTDPVGAAADTDAVISTMRGVDNALKGTALASKFGAGQKLLNALRLGKSDNLPLIETLANVRDKYYQLLQSPSLDRVENLRPRLQSAIQTIDNLMENAARAGRPEARGEAAPSSVPGDATNPVTGPAAQQARQRFVQETRQSAQTPLDFISDYANERIAQARGKGAFEWLKALGDIMRNARNSRDRAMARRSLDLHAPLGDGNNMRRPAFREKFAKAMRDWLDGKGTGGFESAIEAIEHEYNLARRGNRLTDDLRNDRAIAKWFEESRLPRMKAAETPPEPSPTTPSGRGAASLRTRPRASAETPSPAQPSARPPPKAEAVTQQSPETGVEQAAPEEVPGEAPQVGGLLDDTDTPPPPEASQTPREQMDQPNDGITGPFILYHDGQYAGSMGVDPESGVATVITGNTTRTFPTAEEAWAALKEEKVTAKNSVSPEYTKVLGETEPLQRVVRVWAQAFEPLWRMWGTAAPTKLLSSDAATVSMQRGMLRYLNRAAAIYERMVGGVHNTLANQRSGFRQFDAAHGTDLYFLRENLRRAQDALRTSPNQVPIRLRNALRHGLRASGIDFDLFDDFMYARRAIRVENEELASESPAVRAEGSGFARRKPDGGVWTGAKGAQEFLDSLPDDLKAKLDTFSQIIREGNNMLADMQYASGLIDERRLAFLKNNPDYVPLRQLDDNGNIIPLKKSRVRVGRYSKAESPVSQWFNYLENELSHIQSNEFNKALALSWLDHPDLAYGAVGLKQVVPDADSFYVRKPGRLTDDGKNTVFAHFQGGKTLGITFDESKAPGRAMRMDMIQGPRSPKFRSLAPVGKAWGMLTRLYALSYTGLNPFKWPPVSFAWNTLLGAGAAQQAFRDLNVRDGLRVTQGMFKHLATGAKESLSESAGRTTSDPFFILFSREGGGSQMGARSSVNEVAASLRGNTLDLRSPRSILGKAHTAGKVGLKAVLAPTHAVDTAFSYGAFRSYLETKLRGTLSKNPTLAELEAALKQRPEVLRDALAGSRRIIPNFTVHGTARLPRTAIPFFSASMNGISYTAQTFTTPLSLARNLAVMFLAYSALDHERSNAEGSSANEAEVRQKMREQLFSTRGMDAMTVDGVSIPVDPAVQPLAVIARVMYARANGWISKQEAMDLTVKSIGRSQSPLQFSDSGDTAANLYTFTGLPGIVLLPFFINQDAFGHEIHPDDARAKDANGETDPNLERYLIAKPGTDKFWYEMAAAAHALGVDMYPNAFEKSVKGALGGFGSALGKDPVTFAFESAQRRFTQDYNFSAERDNYEELKKRINSSAKGTAILQGDALLREPTVSGNIAAIDKAVKKQLKGITVNGIDLKTAINAMRDARASGDANEIQAAQDTLDALDRARDRVYLQAIDRLQEIQDEQEN